MSFSPLVTRAWANGRIWRGRLWRDVGRPESALIGVQYDGNDRGSHVAPYIVTLHGVCVLEMTGEVWLALEWLRNGSLIQYLEGPVTAATLEQREGDAQ